MDKLVVINNYKKEVEWVTALNCEYIIYNKYDPQISDQYWKSDHENTQEYYKRLYSIPNYLEIMKPISTDIPNLVSNIGHDTYTFFNHMINNYENLADINVFLHSSPFHHCQNIIELVNNLIDPVDFIDFGTSMTSDQEGKPTDTCPVGRIFNQLYPESEIPEVFTFTSGSLFSISKLNIQRVGIDLLKQCRDIIQIEPLAPWAFERLYRTIFTKDLTVSPDLWVTTCIQS